MTPAKMFDGDLYVLVADAVQMAENAYKNGQTDEREQIAQMMEGSPTLVDFAQNEHGGCLVCGFTPKLAVASIRARNQHGD